MSVIVIYVSTHSLDDNSFYYQPHSKCMEVARRKLVSIIATETLDNFDRRPSRARLFLFFILFFIFRLNSSGHFRKNNERCKSVFLH